MPVIMGITVRTVTILGLSDAVLQRAPDPGCEGRQLRAVGGVVLCDLPDRKRQGGERPACPEKRGVDDYRLLHCHLDHISSPLLRRCLLQWPVQMGPRAGFAGDGDSSAVFLFRYPADGRPVRRHTQCGGVAGGGGLLPFYPSERCAGVAMGRGSSYPFCHCADKYKIPENNNRKEPNNN